MTNNSVADAPQGKDTMSELQLLWHFCQVDNDGTPRLGYEDNREVRVGETLTVEGEPVLCEHGLHASVRLWHALGYAQGDKLALCRVTLGGTVLHDTDKSVATERTVIAMLDADTTERLLRDFARWCALQVIHLWDAPDVVRQYLETGDGSLRAAARDAIWDVAWDAARTGARTAARAAARDAAWYAARTAARAAARDAARAVASDAARDVASDAAWYAARDVVWDVAIESCGAELERRALEAMESQEPVP